MIFEPLPIAGAWRILLEPKGDGRGSFARAYCQREFATHGLPTAFPQMNTAWTRRAGTVRGLHYQLPPSAEDKLVRCTRGRLWDVMVDLRPGSPTGGHWFGEELSPEDGVQLFIPQGCAHGYQTLTDDADLLYLVSACYDPKLERGLRWNDSEVGIAWPLPVTEMSPRDQHLPGWREQPRWGDPEASA